MVNSLSVAYNNCFLSQKPQVFIVSPEHLKHACGSPFSIAMGSGPSASPLSSQTKNIPRPMSANIYSAYHESEETACYKEGRKENKKQEPGTMQNQKKLLSVPKNREEVVIRKNLAPGRWVTESEKRQNTAECKSNSVPIIFRRQPLRHKKQRLPKMMKMIKAYFP